jgi:toxin ParE1/3/4
VKLHWTERAIRDLVAARAYVEPDNPKAAAELASRIVKAAERLSANRELGRKGRLPGTRELIVARTRHLIPYRIHRNRIELLRVVHTSRRYPPQD